MSGLAAQFAAMAREARAETPLIPSSEKEQIILLAMADKLEQATWQFNLLKGITANEILRMASDRGIQVNFFDMLELIRILREMAERRA